MTFKFFYARITKKIVSNVIYIVTQKYDFLIYIITYKITFSGLFCVHKYAINIFNAFVIKKNNAIILLLNYY